MAGAGLTRLRVISEARQLAENNGLDLGPNRTEGSPVSFKGTDMLRIVNGQATDYWVTSDIVGLFSRSSAGAFDA